MRMRADRESLRLIRVDPEINRFEIDPVSVVWFEHCDKEGDNFPRNLQFILNLDQYKSGGRLKNY